VIRLDVDKHWYAARPSFLAFSLLPLSLIFGAAVMVRRKLYCLGLKKTYQAPVPVIVVGNITTGGTGKTPLVLWLVELLRQQGFRPGIVSRGFGGKKNLLAQHVTAQSDPVLLGDEAVLLAKRAACPLVVSRKRVAAVKKLLADTDCNIIISDDGLQHYSLGRQMEIALIDGQRRFGNQSMLPAGPLREPVGRLATVDFIVTQGEAAAGEYAMQLLGDEFVNVKDSQLTKSVREFQYQTVHALAGIGNPERFFAYLRKLGLTIIPHAFADHYYFKTGELDFGDSLPVMMTEKDAVKCADLTNEHYWYLPVTASLAPAFKESFLKKIEELTCVF
jgi:tetraacyldisaccharide 4'-kinase